jgi:acetyl esterase
MMSPLMSAAISTAWPPALEPATQQFVDTLAGAAPLQTLRPAAARAVLIELQSMPVGKPPASLEDTVFPVGPTGSTRIRIIRPRNETRALPIVMHFHGGGWVLGDADTHDRMSREIAVGVPAAVVFVDYERAPESQYPVAIEQAYAATSYAVEHAVELNVDPARLAIVGDSVGGNMAAAVTLLAKERRGPRIDYQVLFYPVTAANFETGSYRQFAEGPWLTRAAMQWFWDCYLPDLGRRQEITASPLRASNDELRHLPDALVIVDENDVLRDEGEAYAAKLTDAGVRVTSVRYNGTIHDFALLNALADTPAARGALGQAVWALKTALG